MKALLRFVFALAVASLAISAAQRFDKTIRADFFAGFAGNQAALERAMNICEEELAANPQHSEAMVWHGSGYLYLAGKAFEKGDMAEGGQLWGRGMNEMDTAVAMAPDNVGILIPRGATLLIASANMPPAQGKPLLEKGVADYEKARQLQKTYFDKLSGHSRGELLFGLGDGYNRLGRKQEARDTFQALLAVGKMSGHEDQAKRYLADGTYSKNSLSCTGCHTGK